MHVGVGERVHAELVAAVGDPLGELGVAGHLGADHEERAVRALFLQHLQDLRRPDGVGAVVEGECDGLLRHSAAAFLAAGGVDDRSAGPDRQRDASLVSDLGLDVVALELGVDIGLHDQHADEDQEQERAEHDPGPG